MLTDFQAEIDERSKRVVEKEIIFLPKFFDFLFTTRSQVNLLCGGAGSGKSYNVAQFLVTLAVTEQDKEFLVVRKTGPSLRLTCYRLLKAILDKHGIPYKENRSDLNIFVGTSTFFLRSLDDPEKLKSAEFNYIWIEEANELTYDEFSLLRMRLRRNAGSISNPVLGFPRTRNKMFLTFNPVSQFSWLKTKIIDAGMQDVSVCYSNYQDNPFLPKDYVNMLLSLKDSNENLYRIYALGEWGIVEELVYKNWEVVSVEDYPLEGGNRVYGLDFGFNNPSALVEVVMDDACFWVRELLYESGLTNSELIAEMTKVLPRGAIVYADSSEPARIEEINQAGIVCMPANKNVRRGIDLLQRKKIKVCSGSVNLIKELNSYSWMKDRNGTILEQPVKFNDHAMDAMRYAVASASIDSVDIW